MHLQHQMKLVPVQLQIKLLKKKKKKIKESTILKAEKKLYHLKHIHDGSKIL